MPLTQNLEELCGKGISTQAFRDLPESWRSQSSYDSPLQSRVIEVHPEVCFWAMGGGAEF